MLAALAATGNRLDLGITFKNVPGRNAH